MAPKKRAKQDPFGSTTTSDRNDGKYSLRDLPSERPFDPEPSAEPANAPHGPENPPLSFGNVPVQSGLPDLTPIQMYNAASNPEHDDDQPSLEEFEAAYAAAPTNQPPLFQPPFPQIDFSLTDQQMLFQPPSTQFDFASTNQPGVFQPSPSQFDSSSTNQPAVIQPSPSQFDLQQAPVLAPIPEPRGIVEVLKDEIEELKKDKAHKAWVIADLQKLKISITERKNKDIQQLQQKIDILERDQDHYIAERNELKTCKDEEIHELRKEIEILEEEGEDIIEERDLTIANQIKEMAEMKTERRKLVDKYNRAIWAKDNDLLTIKAERDAIQNGKGKEFVDNHNKAIEAKNEEIANIRAERDSMIYAQSEIAKIKAECDSFQNERKKLIEEHHRIIESKNQEIDNITAKRDSLQNEGNRLYGEHHQTVIAKDEEIAKITAERDSLQNEGNKLFEQHRQMIETKDEEIAKTRAERASFDEQVKQVKVYVEEQGGVVEANKQEIAKLTADLKVVSEERDSLNQRWRDVSEKLTEASDQREELKEKDEEIMERDRKLGLLEEQIADLRSRRGKGVSEFEAATEQYREREDAQSKEIARLESELQNAMKKVKGSTSTAEELKKTLENRDTELTECHRKMEQLHDAQTEWRLKVAELKKENASASRLQGSEQNGSHVDLVNQIQQLKTSHDAKVAALQKCDQQRIKEAEAAEAAKQTFALLEEVKEGLEADVGRLHKRVEESRQKTTDLQEELEAYKRNVVTIPQTTKDHVTDRPSPQLFPAPVIDQPSPQLFPASDDLGSFSPSRFRRGRRGRLNQGDGTRARVPVSRWYGAQRSDDCCWSTDEDTDGGRHIQQPQPIQELDREKSTLSFEKDTYGELPTHRRRRHSVEKHMASMHDASTQTDALPPTSESAKQIQPNDKPAATEPSMQTKPNNKPAYASTGTQTMPASKPATIDMGTPAMPMSKSKSKPAMVSRGTQTMAVKKSNSLCWRILYYLLCLLALILLLLMLSYGESNRRERDMWLEANDYTRRAVVSVRAGGGTGMKVPPWLWNEPLIEMPNSYY
ncbi:MAG: hypothetical protein Q9208_003093 [Pyrenodesmia sp. 3 TL-2023]